VLLRGAHSGDFDLFAQAFDANFNHATKQVQEQIEEGGEPIE
jgi:hypothetical protein